MSPDNHYSNPAVKRLIDASTGFGKAFPSLAHHLMDDFESLRGFTLFLGDTNEFVVGLRIFADDGSPEVLWSSGGSPLEAMLNLDRSVSSGKFKVDKKAVKG